MYILDIVVIVLAAVGIGMGIWSYKSKKFRTINDFIWMIIILVLGIIAIFHAAIDMRTRIVDETDKVCYEKYHYEPMVVDTLDLQNYQNYRTMTDAEILFIRTPYNPDSLWND